MLPISISPTKRLKLILFLFKFVLVDFLVVAIFSTVIWHPVRPPSILSWSKSNQDKELGKGEKRNETNRKKEEKLQIINRGSSF